MRIIKKWYIILICIFVINIILTAWFIVKQLPALTIIFGISSTITMFFLIRQSRRFYSAKLICDNSILSVASAIITKTDNSNENMLDKTVISTFGLLFGSKVYKWGQDGIRGPRLHTITINQDRIWLNFGIKEDTLNVEILHGINNKPAIIKISEELWYETGVEAIIEDWE